MPGVKPVIAFEIANQPPEHPPGITGIYKRHVKLFVTVRYFPRLVTDLPPLFKRHRVRVFARADIFLDRTADRASVCFPVNQPLAF